jgi:hypothetical protein
MGGGFLSGFLQAAGEDAKQRNLMDVQSKENQRKNYLSYFTALAENPDSRDETKTTASQAAQAMIAAKDPSKESMAFLSQIFSHPKGPLVTEQEKQEAKDAEYKAKKLADAEAYKVERESSLRNSLITSLAKIGAEPDYDEEGNLVGFKAVKQPDLPIPLQPRPTVVNTPQGGTSTILQPGLPTQTIEGQAKPAPKLTLPEQLADLYSKSRPTPEDLQRIDGIKKALDASKSTGMRSEPSQIAATVEGIRSGILPPDVIKLASRWDLTAITAGLAESGFDQVKATQEWNSSQKFLASSNSTQQLRLRQAVEKIPPHLEIIKQLYDDWKRLGPNSGISTFNWVALQAAKRAPGEIGSVANNLDGQLNDLAAELSNVYMQGNTPTDRALQMGAKNLKAEWNEKTFTDALALVEKNVVLRRNAIRFTGPMGVPVNSPYFPEDYLRDMPTLPTQGAPTPPSVPMSVTPKVGDIKKFPNGKTGKWDGQGWVEE